MVGVAWAVIDDREHYSSLKHMCAPASNRVGKPYFIAETPACLISPQKMDKVEDYVKLLIERTTRPPEEAQIGGTGIYV